MDTELIGYLPDTCAPVVQPFGYGCITTRLETIVPNSFGWDLGAFGSTGASDTYLHIIEDTITGILYWYPPATISPSSPIVATDVIAIQNWITSLGFNITWTVNTYDEIVLFFGVPGEETRFSFWMGSTNTSDSWTNKLSPNITGVQTDEKRYKEVQVIKEKQPDGTYLDRFFIPGTSPLSEVTLNLPLDTFKFGSCPDCKNEIFATHDRIYYKPGGIVPITYTAYWIGDTLENVFGSPGTDATNAFVFVTYGIFNGSNVGEIGADLVSPYNSSTVVGQPLSNLTLLQQMIDYHLPSMGLTVGDVIYTITTDNQPVVFLSPAAVAAIPNPTYIHIYLGTINTPGSYNKYDWNKPAPYTTMDIAFSLLSGACIPVQEIKERNLCTGKESYRFVIEDKGYLVDASTFISGWDETNILLTCPPSEKTRENYVITGITPLVIPKGAISIAITKTSSGGQVLISGDNATDYPLDAQYEVFTDGVNEEVSTLSEYTITGTTAGTTYKIHLIR